MIHGQLSLYTSWCTSPDWNLWNASQLGGREEPPKLSFVTIEMYPKVSNTNQQILLAIGEGLWLSVGMHKRTRCCHPQWKCYRQLKSICAANHRDQCHRHQLLDYLHPNVSTCAAVWRLQCIWPYVCSILFEKTIWQLGMHCSKLDQDPCMKPCMNTAQI